MRHLKTHQYTKNDRDMYWTYEQIYIYVCKQNSKYIYIAQYVSIPIYTYSDAELRMDNDWTKYLLSNNHITVDVDINWKDMDMYIYAYDVVVSNKINVYLHWYTSRSINI